MTIEQVQQPIAPYTPAPAVTPANVAQRMLATVRAASGNDARYLFFWQGQTQYTEETLPPIASAYCAEALTAVPLDDWRSSIMLEAAYMIEFYRVYMCLVEHRQHWLVQQVLARFARKRATGCLRERATLSSLAPVAIAAVFALA